SQATSRAIPTWIVEPAERILLTSTLNGEGLDTLAHLLGSLLNQTLAEIHLRVPASRFDIVSVVHREGEVLDERYDGSDVLIHALFPRQMLPQVTEWQESPTDAMAT